MEPVLKVEMKFTVNGKNYAAVFETDKEGMIESYVTVGLYKMIESAIYTMRNEGVFHK